MDNDYIESDSVQPEEPRDSEQESLRQQNKFSFFDSLNNGEQEITELKQQLEPQEEEDSNDGCNDKDLGDGEARSPGLSYDEIGSKTKLFNKTGDIRAMKGFGDHGEGKERQQRSPDGTRESLATKKKVMSKNSPCKSASFVFEHGRDQNSDTSTQLARNLQAFGGNEALRQLPEKQQIGQFCSQRNDSACQQSEDDDQPSLQSPDPKLVEFRSQQRIFEEDQEELRRMETPEKSIQSPQDLGESAGRTKLAHVIKGLRHQEACRPATSKVCSQGQAREMNEQKRVDTRSGYSSNAAPQRSIGPSAQENDDAPLTESPELAQTRKSSYLGNQEQEMYQPLGSGNPEQRSDVQQVEYADPGGSGEESDEYLQQPAPHNILGAGLTAGQPPQAARRAPHLHKSEQKGARPRKVIDNSYAYHEDIGNGLWVGPGDANLQDAKTPVKRVNKAEHRGKSANQASYSGCMPSAALQAHMEQMLMRQQQQSLSPFSSNAQRNPHFDSIQQLQYQQQLSPFYANPLMNSVCKPQTSTDLTPGTPRSPFGAERLSQYNAMSQLQAMQTNPLAQSLHLQSMQYSLPQQLAGTNPQERDGLLLHQQSSPMTPTMHPMISGAASTGQQYEMLLREKTELQHQAQQLGQQQDESRKQVNQLNAQLGRLKFQLTEKEEDLEESLQTLKGKDTMLQDIKDTLRRQNEQIEQLRKELEQSLQRERQSNAQHETLRREHRDATQKLELLQREQEGRAALIKDAEVNDPNQKGKVSDELLLQKNTEIYQLTVELGCLREENNELKGNVKMQKADFTDRFNEQRKRLDDEFYKLQEEFEYYKVESQDAFKDSQATIIEYSRKIKELEDQLGAQKKLLADQDGKHLAEVKELQSQLEQLQKQLEEQQAESGQLKQAHALRQQELETEVDELTASKQVMKNELEKAQEEIAKGKKEPRVLTFNQSLASDCAAPLSQHQNGRHGAKYGQEAQGQSVDALVDNLGDDGRLSQLEEHPPRELHDDGSYGQTDGQVRQSKQGRRGAGSQQLWPTHNAVARGEHFGEDQQQRARILESPSSSKAADCRTDAGNLEQRANHKTAAPTPGDLQGSAQQKHQISQDQHVRASQLAEAADANDRHPQAYLTNKERAHPWLPSRGPGAHDDAGGASASAAALSGRGGETAQYNPVDTPLGSHGRKHSDSRRGAADGHLFDRDSPQQFGGLHLCHTHQHASIDRCSSPGEGQLTPYNQGGEQKEQYSLTVSNMFGNLININHEQREVDGLECSQPLGAEHLPQRASQVELDASLWERDDGPMGMTQCEEDLLLQEQAEELADTPYELDHPGDQKAMLQYSQNYPLSVNINRGGAVGTGSSTERKTGARAGQTYTRRALGSAAGRGDPQQKPTSQTAGYQSKTSSTINRDQALNSSRASHCQQRSRLNTSRPFASTSGKPNTGGLTARGSHGGQMTATAQASETLSKEQTGLLVGGLKSMQNRSKSGRDMNAFKSSTLLHSASQAQTARQSTATGNDRRTAGAVQRPAGDGVSSAVGPAPASPAPQKSGVTATPQGADLKSRKMANTRSGYQKDAARPSLVGGVSGGPSGPLGVGSRLVAQRRKQQTTAGAMLAESAPKRPSKVVAAPSFVSGGRGSVGAKASTKYGLGATQTNAQLNSSFSQSSQRHSVVEGLNYRSKGLQSQMSGTGQTGKAGLGGGHTVASRAKAIPAADNNNRLLNRDLSQGEFGVTTNFSQNFHTARQFLSRSPRLSGLRSSASFGRMLARESLQSRDQLLERARQQTPHQPMSSGLESPSQLREQPDQESNGEQAQMDRGDPFADASNRMTTPMSAQEADAGDQTQGAAESDPHARSYGKATKPGRGLASAAVKALAASTQNPKTLKNLQGHEGNFSQSNPLSPGDDGGDQHATCATSRVHKSGTVLHSAANPGCLTSRGGGDQVDDDQTKENMTDMKQKLQSIQTGKAYLEKKIQEYEARLHQMKLKKDKTEKSRGSVVMASSASQSQSGLGPSAQGAAKTSMHTSRAHLRDSKRYQL